MSDAPVTTKQGLLRLQQRLQGALDAYYEVCASNSDAADSGDTSVWHDNFAYEQNQRDMHKWAYRVNELEQQVANVRVITPSPNPESVQIGCVIILEDQDEDRQWRFEVAGYDDGDVKAGRISYTSPIMRKMLGGRVGDEYELMLAGKTRTVCVVAIDGIVEQED